MSWLSMLKYVPWQDVVAQAPTVLEAARKLWDKTQTPKSPTVSAPAEVVDDTYRDRELAQLRRDIQEIQAQSQNASQILETLAEQNAALVAEVARLRQRLMMGGVLTALSLLAIVTWLILGQ